MSNKKQQAASSGLGIGTIIFIVFLVMKLAEIGAVASWSWWWVCSPLWIPIGLALGVFGIALLVIWIISLLDR